MATTINATTTGLVETSDGTALLDLQTGGTTALRVNASQAIGVGSSPSFGTAGQFLTSQGNAASPTWTSGGTGTVTSVGWTGGIVSVATATTTPAFTIAGTSGGIPYFSSGTTWASSAALTANGVVYGGGAGAAPVATAAGTTGQFLGANTGGAPTWQSPPGAPGGSTTQIQFNSAGSFGGAANLVYDGTNFLFGLTTQTNTPANGIVNQNPTGGTQILIGHANGTGTGVYYEAYFYNSTVIGSITQNGTTGVLFNITSDYRLKNNPTPVLESGAFIDGLQPKTWDWYDGSGKGVGFVAHEFMSVAKYSGHGEKDAVDENGAPVYQSIQSSSSEVMANIVAELQSLRKRLAELEAKVV
jgi:hypothetical protein